MHLLVQRMLLAAGILLVLFGSRCLNYTKPSALEHHMTFARSKGLPQPSNAVMFGGGLSMAAGGGMLGYGLGRWKGISREAGTGHTETSCEAA
jgi:hypothetical protein